MNEAAAALWTLAGAILVGLATVIPPLFSLIRERIENERARIRREASFDAAATIEERARKSPGLLTGEAKLQAAVELANESTPSRVRVTTADVEAGVTRLRASMATPSSIPPTAILVPMSSAPTDPAPGPASAVFPPPPRAPVIR